MLLMSIKITSSNLTPQVLKKKRNKSKIRSKSTKSQLNICSILPSPLYSVYIHNYYKILYRKAGLVEVKELILSIFKKQTKPTIYIEFYYGTY